MSADENLPPEIMAAILHRLPARSLGRFKCVSNPWRSQISDPQFTKTHLHLHQINPYPTSLILLSDTKSLYSLDLNQFATATGKPLSFPPPAVRWSEIYGSCDGLILAEADDRTISLLNPATREVSQLPVSRFALPPDESFVMYGFGYDSSTDDYKVVSISFWDTDNEHNPDCTDMLVNVYSQSSNSWRKLKNSPYDHAVGHLVGGVLLNGNLHWLASRVSDYSSALVAFSLDGEEWSEVALPDPIADDMSVFNEVVVLGGKLAVFGCRLGGDVWVMEEYGVCGSWKKVVVDGLEMDLVRPVCLMEGGIVLGGGSEVFVYDLEEKRCRNVNVMVENGFEIGGVYVESLVSPNFIRGTP